MSQELPKEITLYKKMLKVMKKIQAVQKSGVNSHHKYQYSTESDFIEAVREHFLAEGVIVLTSVEECTKEGSLTTVKTKHMFIDSENGQNHTVYSFGTGTDSQDKGVYKAITGAMKYFISKSCMIETQDDPENDGVNTSYTKGTAKIAAKTPKTIPTTKGFQVPKVVESTEEVVEPIVEKPKVLVKQEVKKDIPQPKAIKKPLFGKKLVTTETTDPSF